MYDLDRALFYWINHGWSHPLLDSFFPWITHLRNSAPAVGVLVIWLLVRGGRRGRICVLTLTLAIGMSDRFSVEVLKPGFDRERPCIALEDTNLLVKKRKSPSCPSSHAANIFAAALVMGFFYRRSLWIGLPIATTVALSRVYVGVHYPFDVTFGALYGTGVGAGALCIVRQVGKRVPALSLETAESEESQPEATIS